MRLCLKSVVLLLLVGYMTTAINNPKKKYRIFREKLNWHGALLHCISNNMALATIVSQQEQDQVQQLLQQSFPNELVTYWLGAADIHKENDFTWYSTAAPLTYSNLHPNKDRGNEDCLEIVITTRGTSENYGLSYPWNDYRCDATNYFICEYFE